MQITFPLKIRTRYTCLLLFNIWKKLINVSCPLWDMSQCETVDPADVKAVAINVIRALAMYGTAALKEMILNCMAQDLSWNVSRYSLPFDNTKEIANAN